MDLKVAQRLFRAISACEWVPNFIQERFGAGRVLMLQKLVPVRTRVLREVGFCLILFFPYHLLLSISLRFLCHP